MIVKEIKGDKQVTAAVLENVKTKDISNLSVKEAREKFEREYFVTQLKKFGGSVTKTAKFVGMERSALHRKLKMLGIQSKFDV